MSDVLRVAVLASGSGSNLQSILDRFNLGDDAAARVVRVIASKPGIRALERARDAGVETSVLPRGAIEAGEEAEAAFLLETLEEADAGFVVLAGYLRLVPAGVVRAYRGRIVNIHPALLPTFGGEGMYGERVHRAVLESGVRVTGVTVHFVDEEYDRGPIAAQWPVPVLEGDDPGGLAARVLEVEHRVLPAVVAGFARGELRLTDEGRSRWTRRWFPDGESFVLAGGGESRGPGER